MKKTVSYQEIMSRGLEVFGGSEKFNQWLKTYNKFLEAEPEDLIYHPSNRELLINILGRVQSGNFPQE